MPTLSNLRLPPRGRPPTRRPRRAARRLTLGFGLGLLGGWLYGLLRVPTVAPAEPPAGTLADPASGEGRDPVAGTTGPSIDRPVQVDLTGPRSVAGTTP